MRGLEEQGNMLEKQGHMLVEAGIRQLESLKDVPSHACKPATGASILSIDSKPMSGQNGCVQTMSPQVHPAYTDAKMSPTVTQHGPSARALHLWPADPSHTTREVLPLSPERQHPPIGQGFFDTRSPEHVVNPPPNLSHISVR